MPRLHLYQWNWNVWRWELGALNSRFRKDSWWKFYCITLRSFHRLTSERRGETERDSSLDIHMSLRRAFVTPASPIAIRSWSGYGQWCAGKCLTDEKTKKKSPNYSVLHFLLCNYSHHAWPISSYQDNITDCGLAKKYTHLALASPYEPYLACHWVWAWEILHTSLGIWGQRILCSVSRLEPGKRSKSLRFPHYVSSRVEMGAHLGESR